MKFLEGLLEILESSHVSIEAEMAQARPQDLKTLHKKYPTIEFTLSPRKNNSTSFVSLSGPKRDIIEFMLSEDYDWGDDETIAQSISKQKLLTMYPSLK